MELHKKNIKFRVDELRRSNMTVKEIAKGVIDTLPDNADMEEIIHALYIKQKFDRGIRQIKEGKGIPLEEAKKIMRSWVKKG